MGIRNAGFAVLAIGAIVVTFAMAPEPADAVDVSRYDRQIEQALQDFESNEARTQGAPQQQVVNGWVARDLLTTIAQQQSAALEVAQPAAADDRIPRLLLLMVLALCWHAATLPRPVEPSAPAASSSSSSVGDISHGVARHGDAPDPAGQQP